MSGLAFPYGSDYEQPLFLDQPAFRPRRLRIVCVGAGFSGLTLAYKIQHESLNEEMFDLTIYEKNSGVGGTWFENVYPGVACDIPAHAYTFSFAPNPNWRRYYATGPEILEYIKQVTEQYQLDKNVRLNHRIVETSWNNLECHWNIAVQDARGTILTDSADILVHGGGILNKWRWPSIPGLHAFDGKLVHSAAWDTSLDWKSKRVALIGNGSSGIQILPEIARTAKRVTNYIRSPTWICTPLGGDESRGGADFEYTEEERNEFRMDPKKLKDYRRHIEHLLNRKFPCVIQGSSLSNLVQQRFEGLMRQRLNNKGELIKNLIPDFPVFCRRLTPGEGYLEALQAANVRAEFNPIRCVTSAGIVAGKAGLEIFDMIICATGFDTSFIPSWKVTGKKGVQLSEQWSFAPEAYFGVCTPNMPNFFMFNGPNSPVSQGSLTTVIDFASEYILKWCRKIATQGIKSVCVKSDATAEYNAYANEFLKRSVWAGSCRSWYKNGQRDGKISGIYGGSLPHYWECLEAFRSEDFDIQYHCHNRFQFMGNGRTSREMDGSDLGFHLDR